MFKPSPCMNARLRLTTKQVNGGYYKGNRTGNVGFFGWKKGTYVVDWRKVRTYEVPKGLADFKLTPFVTQKMEPTKDIYRKEHVTATGRKALIPRALNGEDYLQEWARLNPEEAEQLGASKK